MNVNLCQRFDDLLEHDVDRDVMYALFIASRPYSADWEYVCADWEYVWSLDIMHLNFPFLN